MTAARDKSNTPILPDDATLEAMAKALTAQRCTGPRDHVLAEVEKHWRSNLFEMECALRDPAFQTWLKARLKASFDAGCDWAREMDKQNDRALPDEIVVDRYRFKERPAMGDVFIEDRGDGKWAVVNKPDNLNKDGQWEYEPQPSSRDDAFKERCRFNSPHEARQAVLNAIKKIGEKDNG